MPIMAADNRSTGCSLSTGTQAHQFRSLASAAEQKANSCKSGCICLAKGWQRQHLSGRDRTEGSEPSRAVTRCTAEYLVGEQTR